MVVSLKGNGGVTHDSGVPKGARAISTGGVTKAIKEQHMMVVSHVMVVSLVVLIEKLMGDVTIRVVVSLGLE